MKDQSSKNEKGGKRTKKTVGFVSVQLIILNGKIWDINKLWPSVDKSKIQWFAKLLRANP